MTNIVWLKKQIILSPWVGPDNIANLQNINIIRFGRYAGRRLIDLPEPYLVWFRERGYPRGRLGELLATLYEIKANGLEPLLAALRDPTDPRYRKDADPRRFREGDH